MALLPAGDYFSDIFKPRPNGGIFQHAVIPHACPICKGCGEIPKSLTQHGAEPITINDDEEIYRCHVCDGRGVLWEPRNIAPLPVITPPMDVPIDIDQNYYTVTPMWKTSLDEMLTRSLNVLYNDPING